MDVAYLNIVSKPDSKPLELTTIDHAAFSPDSLWLATVRINWDYVLVRTEHTLFTPFYRLRQEMTRLLLN